MSKNKTKKYHPYDTREIGRGGGVGEGKWQPTPVRTNNVVGGRGWSERIKNKHTKDDFMGRKRSKGE